MTGERLNSRMYFVFFSFPFLHARGASRIKQEIKDHTFTTVHVQDEISHLLSRLPLILGVGSIEEMEQIVSYKLISVGFIHTTYSRLSQAKCVIYRRSTFPLLLIGVEEPCTIKAWNWQKGNQEWRKGGQCYSEKRKGKRKRRRRRGTRRKRKMKSLMCRRSSKSPRKKIRVETFACRIRGSLESKRINPKQKYSQINGAFNSLNCLNVFLCLTDTWFSAFCKLNDELILWNVTQPEDSGSSWV